MLLIVGLMGSPVAMASGLPDSTIDINTKITADLVLHSQEPGIDDASSWFPGLAKKGTVRITNNAFYKVKISNIGLQLEDLSDPALYDAFADNMEFTIKRTDESDPIYSGPFKGIMFVEGSGVYKGKDVNITIDRLGSLDFECTVAMKLEKDQANNTLQGLKSHITLRFNTNELPAPSSDGDGGGAIVGYMISDMSPDHWAYECVQNLIKQGIITLESGNKIRPEDGLNRAEAAVLIGKALGLEPVNSLFSGYLDPLPDWARGYIIATSEAGIFHGYPGWLFKPNKKITREELACVLVRAFKKTLDGDVTLPFTDADKISSWALEDVKIAVQHNLIGGYPDGTFQPDSFITRAESFSIVCRILKS